MKLKSLDHLLPIISKQGAHTFELMLTLRIICVKE